MKEEGLFTRYNSHQAAEETLAAIMVWKEDGDPSSCKVELQGRATRPPLRHRLP